MPFFLPIFDVARMVFYDFTSQHITVDMCVNLGGRRIIKNEHALNSSQVGASFKKVCCERMPECVWTDVFGDTCHIGQFFDKMKDHDT